MFTIKRLHGRFTVAVAVVVMILVAAALPGASVSDRGNDAWSNRLTGQAQVRDEARAARAASAWSQRLSGLAERQHGAAGMSDRAIAAWADRLTGLAEYEAARK